MKALMDWLPAHIPASDEAGVVHGDFRVGNCIVHPTEPRVIAVLDWELSTLGHPLGDLAYFCQGFRGEGVPGQSLAGLDLAELGIPTEEEVVARYCALTGRESIEHWSFYLVFVMFRSAAIVQGVYKRGLDGNAASARVAFAGPYPGKILRMPLANNAILCQRDSFLCAAGQVDINVEFTKRLGAGFFGGEGFILERLEGTGEAFIHSGGTIIEMDLKAGEKVRVDTGCLVAFDPSVDYDIQFVGGIKTAIFGGEGLFFATMTGPGRSDSARGPTGPSRRSGTGRRWCRPGRPSWMPRPRSR